MLGFEGSRSSLLLWDKDEYGGRVAGLEAGKAVRGPPSPHYPHTGSSPLFPNEPRSPEPQEFSPHPRLRPQGSGAP